MEQLEPTPPPPDAREFLASVELLKSLSAETIDTLLPEVEWLRAPGGTVLFWQGDPGDAVYFVYSGRVRVSMHRGNTSTVLAEFGRGLPIGEIGLLTHQGRSATVRAIRDTQLVRFTRATFDRLIETHPKAGLPLARVVAERLMNTQRRQTFHSAVSTVAIIPVGRAAKSDFILYLMRALEERARVLLVTPELAAEELGTTPLVTDVMRWMDQQEAQHRLLVLEADPTKKGLDMWIRQADRIVVVGDATETVDLGPARPLLAQLAARGTPITEELVLLHPGPVRPGSTEKWLASRSYGMHHHIRNNQPEDYARLARWLLGRSVGVIFSGGGARTFAEIGVVRAMRDLKLPIDRVGGSSLGAVLAVQVAAGWDAKKMLTVNRVVWRRGVLGGGLAFPHISLKPSRHKDAVLRQMFGTGNLEDLHLSAFGTSLNLTKCELAVHRRGPIVKWLGAALATPALQPPVIGDAGELHVDGSIENNLPVDVMLKSGDGVVIAINVARSKEIRADASLTEPPAGFGHYLKSQFSKALEFPDMIRIMHRTAEVTSFDREQATRLQADLCLEPPLSTLDPTDYRQIERLEQTAYDHALPQLRAFAERNPDLLQ